MIGNYLVEVQMRKDGELTHFKRVMMAENPGTALSFVVAYLVERGYTNFAKATVNPVTELSGFETITETDRQEEERKR